MSFPRISISGSKICHEFIAWAAKEDVDLESVEEVTIVPPHGATKDFSQGYSSHPDPFDEEAFISLFTRCVNIKSLHLEAWVMDTLTDASLSTLAAFSALSKLEKFFVGWDGRLALETFFKLLVLMPRLKHVQLGRLFDTDTDISHLPRPVAQLESLIVCDDWGIDFQSYSALLNASSSSLKSLELSWISDIPKDDFYAALEVVGPSLERLSFIGNSFCRCSDVVSRCANLKSLTIADQDRSIPTGIIALRAPLHELYIEYPYVPDAFGDAEETAEVLYPMVKDLPSLRELKKLALVLPMNVEQNEEPNGDVAKLRKLCVARNIAFLTTAVE